MNKEQFDNIIKQNLIEVYGKDAFGYALSKTYWNYYTKDEFDQFKMEMQSPKYIQYFEKYSEGKGSELSEKSGRYGTLPPKMASVASSSRFCYLALRDGVSALGGFSLAKYVKAHMGSAYFERLLAAASTGLVTAVN